MNTLMFWNGSTLDQGTHRPGGRSLMGIKILCIVVESSLIELAQF
jgi:hypothetical protein